MSEFIMPSAVADQKKIAALLSEAVRCMTEIDVQKEDIKAVKDDLKEKFGMDGGTSGKLIKAFYDKQKVQDDLDQMGELLNIAETLIQYKV